MLCSKIKIAANLDIIKYIKEIKIYKIYLYLINVHYFNHIQYAFCYYCEICQDALKNNWHSQNSLLHCFNAVCYHDGVYKYLCGWHCVRFIY